MENITMTLITKEQAPQFTIPGLVITGMASPSRGATETAVWKATIEPNSLGMDHQVTREEIFVCLSGKATATLGGTVFTLLPGSTFIVPPHVVFNMSNPYDEPVEVIAVIPIGGQAIVDSEPAFTPPWAS
jgi:quercetin dioxygenase-like cupin family protein